MCWISVEYIGMSLFEEVLLYCASWGFAAKSMRFDNVIQGLCCFPCTLLYFHNSIRRAMGAGRMDPLANCCWAAKWNKTGPSHQNCHQTGLRSRGWITSKFFPSVVRWLWAEGFSFSEVFILSAAPGVCWRSMPKLWMFRRINSWRCLWIGYQNHSDLDPIDLAKHLEFRIRSFSAKSETHTYRNPSKSRDLCMDT